MFTKRLGRLVCAPLVLLALATARADAQSRDGLSTAARHAIDVARAAVWRAWFAGDTASLSALVGPALAARDGGGWQDRTAVLKDARDFARGGGRLVELHFDSTTYTQRGPTVVVQGRYSFVIEDQGKRSTQTGDATELFVQDRGRWINPFWYLTPSQR